MVRALAPFASRRGVEAVASAAGIGSLVRVPARFRRVRISSRLMFTLFHHPFCPHSRFIRLAIAEHGLELRLVEERAWERRHEFLVMNPAGTTPVLVSDGVPAIPGAAIICEYLDETYGPQMDLSRRLMANDPSERIE